MAAGMKVCDEVHSDVLSAELLGSDVLVWDLETAAALRRKHRIGMSGVGGLRQTKAHVRRKAGSLPLILTAFETRLGMEQGFLQVFQKRQGAAEEQLLWKDISCHFRLGDRWEMVFAVYADLHSNGWYFTDGIRFGVDFLLYGADPSTAHAPLMLTVARGAPLTQKSDATAGAPDATPEDGISPVHLSALQRVAHRSAKQVLLAWVRCFEDGSPGAIMYQEVTRSYSPAPMPDGVEYV